MGFNSGFKGLRNFWILYGVQDVWTSGIIASLTLKIPLRGSSPRYLQDRWPFESQKPSGHFEA